MNILEMESETLIVQSVVSQKKFTSAVVYVLQCIDNYYYIGSTINDPRYRLNNHKRDSLLFPTRPVYEHINEIGWDNVDLQVIEEYPCDTREELYLKEDEFIKQSLGDEYCLNHIRASVSREERRENVNNYYLVNREKIIEQHKEYLQANKEKVDAYHANYRKDNAEKRCEYSKQYAAEHPEEVKAAKKVRYEANKQEILEKQKAYVEANKEEVKRRKKEWAEKNREYVSEQRKKWAEENKGIIQQRGKEYYEQNKNLINEKNKAYREENKEKISETRKLYRAHNSDTLKESHMCECGGKYTNTHRTIHNQSKRHTAFINSTV